MSARKRTRGGGSCRGTCRRHRSSRLIDVGQKRQDGDQNPREHDVHAECPCSMPEIHSLPRVHCGGHHPILAQEAPASMDVRGLALFPRIELQARPSSSASAKPDPISTASAAVGRSDDTKTFARVQYASSVKIDSPAVAAADRLPPNLLSSLRSAPSRAVTSTHPWQWPSSRP